MSHVRKPRCLYVLAKGPVTVHEEVDPLHCQYGGVRKGGWIYILPSSWVPWVHLCRLSPPVALILVYLPPLFGVLHTAGISAQGGAGRVLPVAEILRSCSVLFGAAFFGSNAAHAWNDLVDAPLDAQITRTRNRPIPCGAVSRHAAALFAVSQVTCLLGTLFLFLPHPQGKMTVIATIPALLGTMYYPFAKRHTNLPQIVLGFCLTWAIMAGSSAVGDASRYPWTNPSTLSLLLAAVIWVILFDTIYAHQDVADDLHIGVGSIAVLLLHLRVSYAGLELRRIVLWLLLAGMTTALIASGHWAGMSAFYYAISVGGSAISVGAMVAKVDFDDPTNCWLWFSKGFWVTGLSIAGGLLVEYAR